MKECFFKSVCVLAVAVMAIGVIYLFTYIPQVKH